MEQLTLRALRVNQGWNLDEACVRLGISKNTLCNYENAKNFPDVPMIKRIEDVYNVSYDKINFLLPDNENIVIKKED